MLGEFEVFRWNLQNAAKVLEVQRHQGFDYAFDQGLTQVRVDLIQLVISDCWIGFRGDDSGWPRFDQSQRVWLGWLGH
jgi:hypothetical protein